MRKRAYWPVILLCALFLFSLSLYLEAAVRSAPAGRTGVPPRAVWGANGLEINNTPGNTSQENPRLISSQGGAYFMVWEDGRNGYTNLYAQKVDESGARQWNADGVAVAQADGNQNYAKIIEDGAGGLIITWQDYRGANADIYAQRISAQGGLLWGQNGVPVSRAEAGQFAPELVADGAGGVIITWHDYRSGGGEDVFAQRVDKEGTPLWQENGVAVCTVAGTQWYPKIAGDGAGGAVIVWTDGRSSSADNNIYAQRVASDGKALWEKDGVAVCGAPQNQERPVIDSTDGGFIIAWNDLRSGNSDIYLQKIDAGGNSLWAKDGVVLVSAPFSQEDPRLVGDGAGGAVAVWNDNREDEAAVYFQRINKDGGAVWGENGRLIAKTGAKQINPEIARGSLGWAAAWEDYRKGSPAVYCQNINREGIALGPEGGVAAVSGFKDQIKPVVAFGSAGEIAVAWQDRRTGNSDIYSQKFSAQGAVLWGEAGNVVCEAIGSVIHQKANTISAGGGDVMVVFEDARSGYFNIYAQKVTKGGVLAWGKDGIAVAKIKAHQNNPRIISDGVGGALVIWEDYRDQESPRIFAQRINGAGKKIWEGGSLAVCEAKSKQTQPIAIPDGAGGVIIVWQDERNPLSYKDLFAQRISAAGGLLWDKNGSVVCAENGDQAEPAIIADGVGGAVITWTDFRRGERNPDIYSQRIDNMGQGVWQKDGVQVCGAPDVQRTPQISSDGESGAVIAWTDKGGGSYDIYAQRINGKGQALWLRDGIPINQMGRTQQDPVLANSRVIFWEDYRYGNWDIFSNAVSAQGKLLWGEEGVPIVTLPLTQYAPRAVGWKDGGAIVAWEDYRSGKQYEIYLQKVSADGRAEWQENGIMVKTADGARSPGMIAIPAENSFVVVWEDYTGGNRAIFAQKFTTAAAAE